MTQFILAYHGGGRMPESPEEGAKMKSGWEAWIKGLGDAVVEPGWPVGQSITVSSSGVTNDGGPNPLFGVTILQAESIDAVVEMVKKCPHLEFMGDIEVAPIVQMD